jgi:phospholipid transport system transporter-binding protein
MRVEATDIGVGNAAQIAEAGMQSIRAGDHVLDLSKVQTCDSSGVAVVLAWQREAQALGVKLALSGLPAGLVSLADVYGVTSLLEGEGPPDR